MWSPPRTAALLLLLAFSAPVRCALDDLQVFYCLELASADLAALQSAKPLPGQDRPQPGSAEAKAQEQAAAALQKAKQNVARLNGIAEDAKRRLASNSRGDTVAAIAASRAAAKRDVSALDACLGPQLAEAEDLLRAGRISADEARRRMTDTSRCNGRTQGAQARIAACESAF